MPVNPNRGRFANPKLTKTQRLHRERLLLNLRALQNDHAFDYDVRESVPKAWNTLEHDIDVTEKKIQISIRLDESVAKFYRAMGQGYQGRINRILATYAQMRIAEIKTLDEMVERETALREAEEAERAKRGPWV